VHRVLGQLEKLKLIIRDRSRERYSIGPRLSRLAFVTLRSLNQSARQADPQELVDDIGETCNVGVLDDLDYVFLQLMECRWPLRLHQEVGTRIAAHTVSGGKLLLAYLDPVLSRNLIKARKLKAATSHTLTSLADLEAEFVRIRASGYALNNQERIDGVVGVAVPVFDPDGNVLASVGMHGPCLGHHEDLRAPRTPPAAGRGPDRPRGLPDEKRTDRVARPAAVAAAVPYNALLHN
jgi:DNA-binding IclR family transcriptional regulator